MLIRTNCRVLRQQEPDAGEQRGAGDQAGTKRKKLGVLQGKALKHIKL